jgi:hypothetical protein
MHVIPELRLGNNSVGCEEDHPVSLRVWGIIGGCLAAHNLKLLHYTSDSHSKLIDKYERDKGMDEKSDLLIKANEKLIGDTKEALF